MGPAGACGILGALGQYLMPRYLPEFLRQNAGQHGLLHKGQNAEELKKWGVRKALI